MSVGAQSLQGPFDRGPDVGGGAVHGAGSTAGVGDQTELGGDDDVVAAAGDGLADDFLAVEGAVDLRGVDVGDAQVQGAVDGADRLGVVDGAFRGVGAGHGHGAETDTGDIQGAQVCVLHDVVVLRCGRVGTRGGCWWQQAPEATGRPQLPGRGWWCAAVIQGRSTVAAFFAFQLASSRSASCSGVPGCGVNTVKMWSAGAVMVMVSAGRAT